jgi:hypothetical protein
MRRRPSHIYVMSDGADLVKIGLSCQLDRRAHAVSTSQRAATLQWATPVHTDPLTIEMTAHTLLREQHVTREWFRASVEEAIAAISVAVKMVEAGDFSRRKRPPCSPKPRRSITKTKFATVRLTSGRKSGPCCGRQSRQTPGKPNGAQNHH